MTASSARGPDLAPGTLPWYVWTTVLAASSTVIGVIWDISWHRTIGRDTFWTPAHIAIYLGGVLAGVTGGVVVLRTTFGPATARGPSVRFWGFQAPLGVWLCIWGAFAMVTSAPFDNWWHNAYGLDVKVLSPPHVLLALGMWGIQFGALLLVLAQQNRATDPRTRRWSAWGVALLAGIILENGAILGIEQVGFANAARTAVYYQFAAACFPVVLLAAGRAGALRWSATATAAAYMAISLGMIWILELFPATPKLAPVFNPVTHMVPAPFPLLLVVPALALDRLLPAFGRGRDGALAVAAGLAFLAIFLVVQWFAADFLLSAHARNVVFGVDHWDYSSRLGPWRYQFWRTDTNPVTPAALGAAALLAVCSSRIGLWWGSWMSRVKR